MIGKFNTLSSLEQGSGLIPDITSDVFSVAPEFDSTEELRVEIYDNEESCPIRYTSDVRLLLHAKDLASRAGIEVASKFGQNNRSASQIQQIMDTMSDDDLLSTVRSRHIQAPSEIIAWSKELSAYAENLESQAQELINSATTEQEAKKADAASADVASTE